MIRCMIVDDEESAINVLKKHIEKIPFLELVGTALDPLDALEQLHYKEVDVIFLDIHMPNISGLEFMELVKGRSKVVLTTAYSEFAIEGFEQEAMDYLLKPIAFDRFLKTAQRALNNQSPIQTEPLPAEKENDYIFVKTEMKGRMVKVLFRDIIYIEGLKNYVSFYTHDERIISYISFKQLEDILPSSFLRVHKSYIISLDRVRAVDGNQILLHNVKAYIPLGETYRNAFFTTLQDKIVGGKSKGSNLFPQGD